MAPFDRPFRTSYRLSTVTVVLSVMVSPEFNIYIYGTPSLPFGKKREAQRVADGANRKGICALLFVFNTNYRSTSHRFAYIAA